MITIKVPGADFSNSNVGNIDPIITFARLANLSESQQTAYNNFRNTLVSAEVWDLLEFIYPFQGANAETQRLNLKDPNSLALNFINDTAGAHINEGYLPTGSQTAFSPWKPKQGEFLNGAVGVYNITSVSGTGYDLSLQEGNFYMQIARALGTPQTVAGIGYEAGQYAAADPSYAVNKTGLLSALRLGSGGNNLKLLDKGGANPVSRTNAQTPQYTYGDMYIGRNGSKVSMAYVMGTGATVDKVNALSNAADTLLAALGRI